MLSKPLAIVTSYEELHDALRARAEALDVSRETLDAVSGLQSGYCAKLLAPVPIKAIGRFSLGPLLGALGLKIVLIEDVDMLRRLGDRLAKRLIPQNANNASGSMLPSKHHKKSALFGNLEWSAVMNARRALLLSRSQRSEIASTAARARWRRATRAQDTSPAAAQPAPV